MPEDTTIDHAQVKASATHKYQSFAASTRRPARSGALLTGVAIWEQIKGLSNRQFTLDEFTARRNAKSTVCGACFMSRGRYRLRIYRKTDAGWEQYNFTLAVQSQGDSVKYTWQRGML